MRRIYIVIYDKCMTFIMRFSSIFILNRVKRKNIRNKLFGVHEIILYKLFLKKIKTKSNKIVFCRPLGGLNDMLVQIEKCYRYAAIHNRILYIDTSRSGFLDDFGNYFTASKNVHFGTLDFLNPPFDCYPKCLSNDITTYEVVYDKFSAFFLHTKTQTNVTFNFSMNYKEQILVHEQGGERMSISAFEWLLLKDEIKNRIRTIIDSLRGGELRRDTCKKQRL